MKVIVILNEKGGVGKTTIADHLASGLAARGQRVAAIDADPQANLTSAFGLAKEGALYDLTVRDESWGQCLRLVDWRHYSLSAPDEGALYAVPGSIETRNIMQSISDVAVFRRRLAQLRDQFDYVVIDTSPTPSFLHGSIILATDYVLLPTQLERFSAFEGLPDSLMHSQHTREEAAARGYDVALALGIAPVMYRANTALHNAVLDKLREQYGALVWEPLSYAVTFGDAAAVRQTVFAYSPKAKVARQMWALVDRVREATGGYKGTG